MKHQNLILVTASLLIFTMPVNYFSLAYGETAVGQPTINVSNNQYSIEQAISDSAQLNTLAFGGLGFLTGDLCSDSFLPPGKVADFFGFQYLRDTTQAGKGHSTDFVTNAANNVLSVLNAEQKGKMMTLAEDQASSVKEFAYMRYPLMVAFRRQLAGDLPNGTSGLSKEQVMNYSATLYELDAKISLQRARLFADIILSLNASQKAYLDTMVQGGFASWLVLTDQIDKTSLSHDQHILVMTYASEMFGWYAGDVEADTYFCPERQGDYFGGFYIKDAPAMGNQGYTIDESITGDKGAAFLAALDDNQRSIITSIVNTQRTAINGIVETRKAIATELRKALTSGAINEEKVLSLGEEYGKLDGEISYYYASAFAEVGKTLTTTQKSKLMEIRNLDSYPTQEGKIYLYSEIIDQPSIRNTDFLFTDDTQTNSTLTPTPILGSTSTPGASPISTVSVSPGSGLGDFSENQLQENQFVVYTALFAAAFIAISIIALILRKKDSSIKTKGVAEEEKMKRIQAKNIISQVLSSKFECKKSYAGIKEKN
jgi:hypothetical protein